MQFAEITGAEFWSVIFSDRKIKRYCSFIATTGIFSSLQNYSSALVLKHKYNWILSDLYRSITVILTGLNIRFRLSTGGFMI